MTEPKNRMKDEEESIVLFNKGTSTLPAAIQKTIERMGLKTREKAGIAPTWKPSKPGDYLIGEILAIRHHVGEFDSSCIVVGTPTGPVSLWLTTDLKQKLGDNISEGQVYCFQYLGKLLKSDNPKLKKDMHQYQVVEVFAEHR